MSKHRRQKWQKTTTDMHSDSLFIVNVYFDPQILPTTS